MQHGSYVRENFNKYHRMEFRPDISHLSENHVAALKILVRLGALMEKFLLRQVWSENEALLKKLQERNDQDELAYFKFHMGPWEISPEVKAWRDDVPPSPPKGANFYPEDMTTEEFDTWVATLTEEERRKAKGPFHVIRRGADGRLLAVSYAEAYADILGPASNLLEEAAELIEDASLKTFLRKLAAAFLNNDFHSAEIAGMKVSPQAPFEINCIPKSPYLDRLYGTKGVISFSVLVNDLELNVMAANMLVYKGNIFNLFLLLNGALDSKRLFEKDSSMCVAYHEEPHEQADENLPSRLVLIKNCLEAAFDKLAKVAEVILVAEQSSLLKFLAYFLFVLMHEVGHANGPQYIAGSARVKIAEKLRDLHTSLDEAKADVSGMFGVKVLIQQGVITEASYEEMTIAYTVCIITSTLLGPDFARGLGAIIELNYHMQHDAIIWDSGAKRFSIHFERLSHSVESLVRDLMTMQAEGDLEAARAFVSKYGAKDIIIIGIYSYVKDPTVQGLNKYEPYVLDVL
ncbi:uncharacterized protein VTP21DRAFT_9554 [Calcarisporiella thermophila]|uniref:uncharacterized protein n=1 Tax=Calcarisporiella thermophila TaxID=911321 RepID=UPI003743741E